MPTVFSPGNSTLDRMDRAELPSYSSSWDRRSSIARTGFCRCRPNRGRRDGCSSAEGQQQPSRSGGDPATRHRALVPTMTLHWLTLLCAPGWQKQVLDDGPSLRLTRDGALDDRRSAFGDVDRRPIHDVVCAELRLSSVSHLAAAIRDSIARSVARWPVSPIRVSPMSLAWLRMHETEYDKCRVEL